VYEIVQKLGHSFAKTTGCVRALPCIEDVFYGQRLFIAVTVFSTRRSPAWRPTMSSSILEPYAPPATARVVGR